MIQSPAIAGHIQTKQSWGKAYKSFLLNRDENLALKMAPVFLLLGSPEVIMSNLIPFVGEALDIGTIGLSVIVVSKTLKAVRKYR